MPDLNQISNSFTEARHVARHSCEHFYLGDKLWWLEAVLLLQETSCWRHTGRWSVQWSYSLHCEGLPKPEQKESRSGHHHVVQRQWRSFVTWTWGTVHSHCQSDKGRTLCAGYVLGSWCGGPNQSRGRPEGPEGCSWQMGHSPHQSCEYGHDWWRGVSWWLPHWSQNEPFLWHRVNTGTFPRHTHSVMHTLPGTHHHLCDRKNITNTLKMSVSKPKHPAHTKYRNVTQCPKKHH